MLDCIDSRRQAVAQDTPAKRKSELGQFMTPSAIARFMAGMFRPMHGRSVRLLDAGAGIGSLTAAFVDRAAADQACSLDCEAWEIDPLLHAHLEQTLADCAQRARTVGATFAAEIRTEDFILATCDLFAPQGRGDFSHAILNPPYKKIHSASAHRAALRSCGIETANLYSGFVALAIQALRAGGELVAITPRSFCNGPYFRPFRELLISQCALERVHVFGSRTDAFRGDAVLQENVIFHLTKGGAQRDVCLSASSDASFHDLTLHTLPFSEVLLPSDRQRIFHLAPQEEGQAPAAHPGRYHHTLDELGIGVSTGPVVDYRLRPAWQFEQQACASAPLVYAHHFAGGRVVHPKPEAKKPNWLSMTEQTQKWLMPSGTYVLVRRLSSKEERRRIVPALFEPSSAAGEQIGFENHLNVFHANKQGLEPAVARGLAIYLGSTFADQWLRRFSGHTQVNATDLRAMKYPDLPTLRAWGEKWTETPLSQDEIDALVQAKP